MPRKKVPLPVPFSLTTPGALVDAATIGKVGVRRNYAKEQLKGDVQQLSQRLMTWLLQGDRLETLLNETKLKDVAVVMGIATDKLLLLEGQPTQIVSMAQQESMDAVLPLLMQEMQRWGVKTELTQRTITVTTPSEGQA